MLQINVIPEAHKAVIQYPKLSKIPTKTIRVYSKTQFQEKWEQETRKYIYKILRGWVISRNNAFKVKGELSVKRAYAVDRLLLMLVKSENALLRVMCMRVVEHYEDFTNLLPHSDSRYAAFTKEVVVPVLLWCKEYRDLIEKQDVAR